MRKNNIIFYIIILGLFIGIVQPNIFILNINASDVKEIQFGILNSPPLPPINTIESIVKKENVLSYSQILLNVPTSTWTYGCTATAVGMLFGYYDRVGFPNIYTGSCNGGVCPTRNLGQGSKGESNDYPISNSCYIIATEKGFDGIMINGHVDDYWISYSSQGPDPWFGNWIEHNWDLCVADFIGTNQWKWDFFDEPPSPDSNTDGATTYWTNSDGSKLYDYTPHKNMGLPQTSCCHGCKLFVESRGYKIIQNYNQLTDTSYGHPNGFSFSDFMDEIDASRPVLSHWTKSSGEGHTMIGVGYDSSNNMIYIHDTWDNNLHQVNWNGKYSGFSLRAVTIIKLDGRITNPTVQVNYPTIDSTLSGSINIQGMAEVTDGTIQKVEVKIDDGSWKTAIGSNSWNFDWDTTIVSDGPHTIYVQCMDDNDAYSPESIVTVITSNNPPYNIQYQYEKLSKELVLFAIDPDNNKIRYGISWDNNQIIDIWTDYYNSSEEVRIDCKGYKNIIGVIAEDYYGAQSEWISVEGKFKSYYEIPRIITFLFERFPFLQTYFSHLI